MADHQLLDNITHKNLRIDRHYRLGCGFDHHLARVFPAEFGALQAEYPLFLIRNASTGHYDFVALLGFGPEENLYLGNDEWLARVIPWTIERQPFLIGFEGQNQPSSSSAKPIIYVDMDHPSISQDQGQAVFLPHGGESVLLEQVNQILGRIHEGHQASEALSRTLSGLDLVESLNLEVAFENGQKHALNGLYTINEDRLRDLNPESLGLLHQQGYLQHIYMVLASMPKLAVLIDRKNAKLSGAQE